MSSEQFDKGLKIRKEVMGDDYVERALNSATDFTMPLQEFVTENGWCDLWGREGLPKKTRSLITIATLAALKAPQELKGHVRGALRNGCSVEEIQEVLMHSTGYCGFPAGIEAFRAAKEVIEAWEKNPE